MSQLDACVVAVAAQNFVGLRMMQAHAKISKVRCRSRNSSTLTFWVQTWFGTLAGNHYILRSYELYYTEMTIDISM